MKSHNKIIAAGVAVLGLIGIANSFSNISTVPAGNVSAPTVYVRESSPVISSTPSVEISASPTLTTIRTVISPTSKPTPTATPVAGSLSNDNYYTNSSGNSVHSPAYSDTVPAGASAQCRDGSYSFSQHARGTCSHHGGVEEWL